MTKMRTTTQQRRRCMFYGAEHEPKATEAWNRRTENGEERIAKMDGGENDRK